MLDPNAVVAGIEQNVVVDWLRRSFRWMTGGLRKQETEERTVSNLSQSQLDNQGETSERQVKVGNLTVGLREKRPDDKPMAMSRSLQRLLVSYNLCLDAVDARGIMKDNSRIGLFYAGVIAYYSAIGKHGERLKRKIRNDPNLKGNFTMTLPLDREYTKEEAAGLLLSTFEVFTSLRNKYIAHVTNEGPVEINEMMLKLPAYVDGSGLRSRKGSYVQVESLEINTTDENFFLSLVEYTVGMYWDIENLNRLPEGVIPRVIDQMESSLVVTEWKTQELAAKSEKNEKKKMKRRRRS